MSIITLTTDFGQRDHYVACMKAVILRIAPRATLLDVTHDIPRHNILHGAFVLRQILGWFPPGTIHLAVVDPGVGTERRILAARYADHYLVAPDNGLLSLVHQHWPAQEVRVLENSRLTLAQITSTFHGRDVVAPVAAHLAAGVRLAEVGPLTDHLEVLPRTRPELLPGPAVRGRILHVDHFGNLITNIQRDDMLHVLRHQPAAAVLVGGHNVGRLRQTYSDVPAGQLLALIGSCDLLEIAVNAGNAAERLRPEPTAVVEVRQVACPQPATC